MAAAREGSRLRLPLGERAVQVARDGAADLGDLDVLIVEGVRQMGREILPAGALAGERDYGFRPIRVRSAALISVSSRCADSMASALSPAPARLMSWS